ncbi:hypothetical protein ACFE04_014989 [Oxalis oulophora]
MVLGGLVLDKLLKPKWPLFLFKHITVVVHCIGHIRCPDRGSPITTQPRLRRSPIRRTGQVGLLPSWVAEDKLRSGDVATRDSPHRESYGGEVEDDKVDSYCKEDEIESRAGEEMISKPGYCGLGSSAFWLQLGFGGSLILWKTTWLTKTVHNRLAPDWNHQSCQESMGFHAVTEVSNDRLVTWLLLAISRPQSSGE